MLSVHTVHLLCRYPAALPGRQRPYMQHSAHDLTCAQSDVAIREGGEAWCIAVHGLQVVTVDLHSIAGWAGQAPIGKQL